MLSNNRNQSIHNISAEALAMKFLMQNGKGTTYNFMDSKPLFQVTVDKIVVILLEKGVIFDQWVMMFNASFNNILVMSCTWWLILLVEETTGARCVRKTPQKKLYNTTTYKGANSLAPIFLSRRVKLIVTSERLNIFKKCFHQSKVK